MFTRGAGRVLRSQHPAGIAQEIWALLCTCQLTHRTRAAAASASGLDPDRISYTITLRAIRRALTTASAAGSAAAEALGSLLPPRRRRSYPRLGLTSNHQTARRASKPDRHHHLQDHHQGTSPDQRSARPLNQRHSPRGTRLTFTGPEGAAHRVRPALPGTAEPAGPRSEAKLLL